MILTVLLLLFSALFTVAILTVKEGDREPMTKEAASGVRFIGLMVVITMMFAAIELMRLS